MRQIPEGGGGGGGTGGSDTASVVTDTATVYVKLLVVDVSKFSGAVITGGVPVLINGSI